MLVHCLFEQSGTFKNEFKKLGHAAIDYDMCDEFGETDVVTDIFEHIHQAYRDEPSLFDVISGNDLIMAFFPCTRFECKVPLEFRGEAFGQKKWSDDRKLEYSMKLHEELHRNYITICELCLVCIRRGLRCVIENPYKQPHYLTTYFPLKPKLIDKNRRNNGDYMEKPTQFFFIGFEPATNLVFEALEYVEKRTSDNMQVTDGLTRQTLRSMIHPQYANRFIRQYILSAGEACGSRG